MRGEQLEVLDGPRAPAGHVARELLEHRDGALGAPVRDRVGHEAALAERRTLDRQQPAHAEQVADVRHDPLLAGLDEPVVVEPLDVGLEQVELLLGDRQAARGAGRRPRRRRASRWTAGSRR